MKDLYLIIDLSALGDNCGTLSFIKYACDNESIIAPECNLKICVNENFRALFEPFVPKEKLIDIKCVPNQVPRRNAFLIHPTTLRMHIVDYFSITLGDFILPLEHRNYPLYPTHLLHDDFGFSGKNIFVIASGWTSPSRHLDAKIVNEISDYLISKDIIPVFIGKKYEIPDAINNQTFFSNFDTDVDYSKGIDLIDKTTLKQALKIMSCAKGVVGLDNGLLHLAGLTTTPIVFGCTTVRPEHRLPIRFNKPGWNCYPVIPESQCKFCQSDWLFCFQNDFRFCKHNTYECTKSLTSEMFIKEIRKIVEN